MLRQKLMTCSWARDSSDLEQVRQIYCRSLQASSTIHAHIIVFCRPQRYPERFHNCTRFVHPCIKTAHVYLFPFYICFFILFVWLKTSSIPDEDLTDFGTLLTSTPAKTSYSPPPPPSSYDHPTSTLRLEQSSLVPGIAANQGYDQPLIRSTGTLV